MAARAYNRALVRGPNAADYAKQGPPPGPKSDYLDKSVGRPIAIRAGARPLLAGGLGLQQTPAHLGPACLPRVPAGPPLSAGAQPYGGQGGTGGAAGAFPARRRGGLPHPHCFRGRDTRLRASCRSPFSSFGADRLGQGLTGGSGGKLGSRPPQVVGTTLQGLGDGHPNALWAVDDRKKTAGPAGGPWVAGHGGPA